MKNKEYKKVRECYSTWSKSYYDEYYKSLNNYPPIHIEIVKKILKKNNIKDVLDVGCGPASMIREIISKKISCFGFDLTEEMVLEGKKIFKKLNLDTNNIWIGSAINKKDYYKKKKNMNLLFLLVSYHI